MFAQWVITAAEQHREDGRADHDVLVLTHVVDDVVVDVVQRLVAEHAGQLVLVVDEVHQRVGHVDVAARYRERVRLSLVHEDEPERVLILRIRDGLDALTDRREHGVQRRIRDDLALLLELLVDLLADLLLVHGERRSGRK